MQTPVPVNVRYPQIMRKFLFIIFALSLASTASAREYGTYDPKRLLTVSETPSGKKYGFDTAYLDWMLNDLSAHAKNYPPQFDTPNDKQRAAQDVKTLSGMLDVLDQRPQSKPGTSRSSRLRQQHRTQSRHCRVGREG